MAVATTNGVADYIALDGLRLDGKAWNYSRAVGATTPAVRTAAVIMPGRPGRVYVPGADVHDPAEVSLKVHVQPAHPVTGAVQPSWQSRRAQLEANLQTLLGIVGTPGRSLTYSYVEASGTAWSARATVTVPAQVEVRENNLVADVTFTLEIPEVYLRGSAEVFGQIKQGTGPIANLTGSTAPIYDAILSIPGPGRIECGGQWLTWRGSGPVTVDCGQMTALSGNVSVMKDIGWSGTSMLPLIPTVNADGVHVYQATSTVGGTVLARVRAARFA